MGKLAGAETETIASREVRLPTGYSIVFTVYVIASGRQPVPAKVCVRGALQKEDAAFARRPVIFFLAFALLCRWRQRSGGPVDFFSRFSVILAVHFRWVAKFRPYCDPKTMYKAVFLGPTSTSPFTAFLGGLARAGIVPAVFRVSRSRSVFVRLFESSELLLFPPT